MASFKFLWQLLNFQQENIPLVVCKTTIHLWFHQLQLVSGGEGETSEFIGYVAKDADNQRACHVVEVPSLAPDVIATIGQAFELR